MNFSTAALCDQYIEHRHLHIAEPIFKSFGARPCFSGPVTTIKTFEDNVLLEAALGEAGEGRVLVVDGGGSHRCALLGSRLAQMAFDNGWAGLIIYGCIQDTQALAGLPIGIRALHAHPLKSHKRGIGDRDVLITVAGVNFRSGNYVYVDDDGIVVSDEKLD